MAFPLTKMAYSRVYDVDATPMSFGTCTRHDGIPRGLRSVRASAGSLRVRGSAHKGVQHCLVREGSKVSSEHGITNPAGTTPWRTSSQPHLQASQLCTCADFARNHSESDASGRSCTDQYCRPTKLTGCALKILCRWQRARRRRVAVAQQLLQLLLAAARLWPC